MARNFDFLGVLFADCNSLNTGGNVVFMSELITLGETVCALPSSFLKNRFADCLFRLMLSIQSRVKSCLSIARYK